MVGDRSTLSDTNYIVLLTIEFLKIAYFSATVRSFPLKLSASCSDDLIYLWTKISGLKTLIWLVQK